MKDKRLFNYIILFLFIVYITTYLGLNDDYKNYLSYSDKIVTEAKMAEFEELVASGEAVSVEEFLEGEYDYSNFFSRTGVTVSKKATSLSKGMIKGFIEFLNKMLE